MVARSLILRLEDARDERIRVRSIWETIVGASGEMRGTDECTQLSPHLPPSRMEPATASGRFDDDSVTMSRLEFLRRPEMGGDGENSELC